MGALTHLGLNMLSTDLSPFPNQCYGWTHTVVLMHTLATGSGFTGVEDGSQVLWDHSLLANLKHEAGI